MQLFNASSQISKKCEQFCLENKWGKLFLDFPPLHHTYKPQKIFGRDHLLPLQDVVLYVVTKLCL